MTKTKIYNKQFIFFYLEFVQLFKKICADTIKFNKKLNKKKLYDILCIFIYL